MKFPADRFVSMADYAAWHAQNAALSRARALAEAAVPSSRVASCAPCQRATRLEAGVCDCPDRLDAPARALLHAAVAEAGLCGWSRLTLVGPGSAVFDRLAALAGHVSPEGPADVAVVDPFASVRLGALRAGLVVGGCLLAPLRFEPEARFGGNGPVGWDVLDAARAVGFASAEVLRPWSRELGYFQGMFLLRAIA
jgi:hypothetical protein